MEECVIRSGILFKRGLGGTFRRKNWKPRYFVLTLSQLQYYTSESGEMKGWIDISHCSEKSLEVMPDNDKKTGNSASSIWRIAINTPNRRILVAACNEDDMKSWIDALKAAFQANGTRTALEITH